MRSNRVAKVLRQSVTVTAVALLGVLAMGGATGAAPQAVAEDLPVPSGYGPVGEPYYLDFSHEAQMAVASGIPATASGAICLTTSGAACTISGPVAAIATPFVSKAVVCPNNGIRRLHFQDYSVPPTGVPTPGVQPQLIGNECVPPPPK